MDIDFNTLLSNLSQARPCFHSEEKFQRAVYQAMRGCGVKKLEMEKTVPEILGKERARVDIFGDGLAVELKYPTASFTTSCNGENFTLTNVRNAITGFYRFWKDVWRIETLIKHNEIKSGYVILLSNRPEYWDPPPKKAKNFWLEDFVTQEGKTFSGELAIKPEKRVGGVRKGFENKPNITLKNAYTIHWQNWHNFNKENGLFRYTILEIK